MHVSSHRPRSCGPGALTAARCVRTTRRRSWVCVCILSPSPVLWSRCSDCGQVREDYTEEELGLCMYPLTVPGPVVQVL